MLGWIKYDSSRQPASGQFALVYYPHGRGDLDVKYFVPEKPGYCWGWYPGGRNPAGTYWIPLKDIPVPKEVGDE